MSAQEDLECQDSGMELWSSSQAQPEIKLDQTPGYNFMTQTCGQSWFKTFLSSVLICATAFRPLLPHPSLCLITEMLC